MYVTDQNGNSYDMIDANIDTDISFQNSVWEAALTDATELTIRIVPEGKNNLDAAGTVFTVPIDKGYRTQTINDFDLAENYTQYNPPMPDEESDFPVISTAQSLLSSLENNSVYVRI